MANENNRLEEIGVAGGCQFGIRRQPALHHLRPWGDEKEKLHQ